LDNDDWQHNVTTVPWSAKDCPVHLVTNQETEMKPAASQNIVGEAVEISGLASSRQGGHNTV
jgi:hypothetical protein